LARRDGATALAYADRALAARPGYPAAIQLKADALVASQRAGDAVKLLLAEVTRVPDARRHWRQLGVLLARLGRAEEARRCLARSEEPASTAAT
jgi:predicted Zn-dependent protease